MTRGLIPLLAEGSATEQDTTDEIMTSAVAAAKEAGYCKPGDSVVAVHKIGAASVVKIIELAGGPGCLPQALKHSNASERVFRHTLAQ